MPPDAPIRVLLVEDHALFRRGLRRLLTEHGFEVVGEAGNGEAGVRLAGELRPDVVVTDLHMPIMGGVDVTRRITAGADAPPVLVLTISDSDDDVVDAIVAGAVGYLLKDAEPDDIATALRNAVAGDVTIDPSAAGALVDRVRTQAPAEEEAERLPALSPRELEILELIVEGLDNAEIARRLFLSPSTVKNHVSSLLAKLGVESRVQAAVRAVRSGLL
jgi:two-component system nitrate/nitrite response regulator NarL